MAQVTIYPLKLESYVFIKLYKFLFQSVNCPLSQICRKGCVVNVLLLMLFLLVDSFIMLMSVHYICHNPLQCSNILIRHKHSLTHIDQYGAEFSNMNIKQTMTFFDMIFVMIDYDVLF